VREREQARGILVLCEVWMEERDDGEREKREWEKTLNIKQNQFVPGNRWIAFCDMVTLQNQY